MNEDDKHYAMQYVTGFNKDILEFKNNGGCKPCGIYVTTINNIKIIVRVWTFCLRVR